jgi:hypothetical protein
LSLVCALLAAGSLTGCETVAAAGSTGISVDAQGHPVVVFALCNDHIDGATIYRDRTPVTPDPENAEDATISVSDWEATSPVTPDTAIHASLNTAAPSKSWRRVGRGEPFRAGIRYVAYGWTHDNTWFTGHAEFTLEHLSELKPGQVLTQRYVEANHRHEDTIQPYPEFAKDTCT